jgi:hypothetical protein
MAGRTDVPIDHAHVQRSTADAFGEADLVIVYTEQSGKRIAILIENKIQAVFQPRQAERYRQRGEAGNGWDSFWTCLVAPESYVNRQHSFDSAVTLDSLDQPPDEEKGISPALLRDWREIPSEALERGEIRILIQQAVEQLPDIYREVFLLRDVEELTIHGRRSACDHGRSLAPARVGL